MKFPGPVSPDKLKELEQDDEDNSPETVGDLEDSDSDLGGGAVFNPKDIKAALVTPQPAPSKVAQGPVTDRLPSSAASPDQVSSAPDDKWASISKLLTTPQELKAAGDSKRAIATAGAIGNALANQQSFGNFFTGKMNPHQDVSGNLKPLSDLADQGIQEKQTLLKQEMEKPAYQYMAQIMDPKSEASQSLRDTTKMGLNALKGFPGFQSNPEVLDNLSSKLDGMSGYQINQMIKDNPALKMASDIAKSQATLAMAGKRLDIANQNLGNKVDAQAAGAASKIDSNPVMVGLTKQNNQIDIDSHTLESGGKVTPQMISELGQGLASALGGGKGAGFHASDMMTLKSAQIDLNRMKQYFGDDQLDSLSPENRQFLLDTFKRLGGAYQRARGNLAKQLAVGMNYEHNPSAQKAIGEKVQSYQPQDAGSASQFTPDVVRYAQTHGITPEAAQAIKEKRGGQ